MAVGLPAKTTYADGDVFSASDINDTNGTLNLVGQSQNFYAGKNRIINGDFGIWQRGTSFTPASGAYTYTADRSGVARDGVGATVTISRQSFTPGTAPEAGYESSFFFRNAQSVAGTLGTYNTTYSQIVEDVRTFAGQTVTFSFWAKSDAARTLGVAYAQYFGTGGSSAVYSSTTNVSVTTSWARYSVTFAIPSISGKTIGTGQVGLELYISQPLNTAQTNDIWGVQLEAGSTSTAFQTATGTIQGELAACRRYLPAVTALGSGSASASLNGYAYGTNVALYNYYFDTPARVAPTGITVTGNWVGYALNTSYPITPTFNTGSLNTAQILGSSGITITGGQGSRLENSSVGASILFTGCEL
jgi:hypothetical protein